VLHGYDGMEEVYTQAEALPESGLIIFEDTPMPEGRIYLATTEFGQVAYGSSLAQISADVKEVSLEIAVFDATTDLAGLAVERLHIFFEFPTVGTIRIIQLVLLANASDLTVASSQQEGPVLTFELPDGASNLSVQESMRLQYVQVAGGFGVNTIRPSAEPYEITFSFEMPYEKEKLDLALPVPLDTMAAIVIAPQDGVKIKGDMLQEGGARDFQGVSYSTYSTGSLGAGEVLRFSISGYPKAGPDVIAPGEAEANTNLVIGLGAFGIVLIAVGIYLWRRNRLEGLGAEVDRRDSDDLSPEADTPADLMDAIIALDDLYQAGELPREAYQRRREEMKSRLRDLLAEGD
jgi:hypothetical protein